MLILSIFAFFAGVVTILSPCILPILPIVLSGSLTGGKKRPYGIVTGFVISFTFFTLALTTLVKVLGISPDILRVLAVVVIFIFGLSLVVPKAQELMELLMGRLGNLLPQSTNGDKEGFMSGVVVGLSLGLIWAPCVGPILAAVITLALTSAVTLTAVFITLAYALGTAIPMFAIIQGGRQLLQRNQWLLRNSARIQKIFGILMMLVALGLHLNLDRRFQAYVLTVFPQYGTGLTQFENNPLVTQQLSQLHSTPRSFQERLPETLTQPGVIAPEITNGTRWLNSPELTLADLKGKVVLVDFWTYSCINCIRTFPTLKQWYQKYKDQDFVIVGVHSPEFEFEKNPDNVLQAMKDFGIEYPVVQDNDFTIWQRYENRFWPAHYLIDSQGKIRYVHFGEGEYAKTEAAIQTLLKEAGKSVGVAVESPTGKAPSRLFTPEAYLGVSRLDRFASLEDFSLGEKSYTYPANLAMHHVALQGLWNLQPEYAQPRAQSSLRLRFYAQKIFLVITPLSSQAAVNIKIDGVVPSAETGAGKDVTNGSVQLDAARLYELVNLSEAGEHTLEVDFANDQVHVFAFTSG